MLELGLDIVLFCIEICQQGVGIVDESVFLLKLTVEGLDRLRWLGCLDGKFLLENHNLVSQLFLLLFLLLQVYF